MATVLSDLIEASGVQFGTSGARGLVTQMTDEICWAYCAAFIQEVVPDAQRILVGHDLRPSSPGISQACVAALQSYGKEVIFAGAIPTPALASYALDKKMPAVMVTGSHIPFDRNGIKFYTHLGEISKSDEHAIIHATLEIAAPYSCELPANTLEPLAHYAQRYLSFFPANFLEGKRVGVYEHASVARDFIKELFTALGAEVISLGRSDTFVPVDTEAVSAEDQALAHQWSSKFRLDAIVSTDGDADRPLIGDEAGQWLRGDVVGLLTAQYLKATAVVTPVSSTTAIERSGAFNQVRRTRIGSPYVIAGMEDLIRGGEQLVVGFEANGGFLLGQDIVRGDQVLPALPTRDAVLPMLSLLAMAHEAGVTLSSLVAHLPKRYTASDRIKDFSGERSRALIKALSSDKAVDGLLGTLCGQLNSRDTTDGLRMTFASGDIVHLRPSGNAPELRCYAEAGIDARAQALVAQTLDLVRRQY